MDGIDGEMLLLICVVSGGEGKVTIPFKGPAGTELCFTMRCDDGVCSLDSNCV